MQQQISVITLGIKEIARSKRFYAAGFGWNPVFQNADIVFYQMNVFVLGTWLEDALSADSNRPSSHSEGFALAHNVPTREAVQATLDHLTTYGGRILRPADDPPHGGRRGYITDPDGHLWEIAWNPYWKIGAQGHVTFGL